MEENNKKKTHIVRFENFNDDQRGLCHHSYLIRTHSHTDRRAHKYTHLATRLDEPLWGQCGRGGGGGDGQTRRVPLSLGKSAAY